MIVHPGHAKLRPRRNSPRRPAVPGHPARKAETKIDKTIRLSVYGGPDYNDVAAVGHLPHPNKEPAMLKKLLIALGIVVLVLILAVVAVFIWIDSIAKVAVEKGGTYALGVNTTLDKASIGVFSGHFGMSGLMVANPSGFATPHFLKLGDGQVDVSVGELNHDVVHVPRFLLANIDLNLDKKDGKYNYQVILDNLKKLESGQKQKEEPQAKPGKKFIIGQLLVKNVTVHVDPLGLGATTKMDVTLDEISMQNVGSKGEGVTVAQISDIALKAILSAVMAKAGNILPADLTKGLNEGLSGLQSLASQGIGVVSGDLGKQIGNMGTDVVGNVSKGVGDVGKTLTEGLGGLLGGQPANTNSTNKKP
jgi:hypothetical protein